MKRGRLSPIGSLLIFLFLNCRWQRPFHFAQVSNEDLQLLMKEMDANGDGNVTLKEFAAFINLDDHEPLYQPLFDGRRRNVNILQVCA